MASGRNLPAWFSAGLELYVLSQNGIETVAIDYTINAVHWYVNAVARSLPPLGDEWFIPGFIDDAVTTETLSVAYAFVRYLSEAGKLEGLIEIYMQADPWAAENAWAALWASFTGATQTNVQDVIFRFNYNAPARGIPDSARVRIAFTTLTPYSLNYFTPSYWPWELANEITAIADEAILFVGDWLGYHHSQLITNIHRAPPFLGGSAGGGWAHSRERATTNFFEKEDGEFQLSYMEGVIAHELTHVVLRWHPYLNTRNFRSGFPTTPLLPGADVFEEGLCTLIGRLFIAETGNEKFALETSQDILRRLMDEGYLPPDSYTNRRATREEIIVDVHFSALRFFEIEELLEAREQGEPLAVLFPWTPTASFFFYLLEYHGTEADLFLVYEDISLFEEVYGYDIYDMVTHWLSYLDERFGL